MRFIQPVICAGFRSCCQQGTRVTGGSALAASPALRAARLRAPYGLRRPASASPARGPARRCRSATPEGTAAPPCRRGALFRNQDSGERNAADEAAFYFRVALLWLEARWRRDACGGGFARWGVFPGGQSCSLVSL